MPKREVYVRLDRTPFIEDDEDKDCGCEGRVICTNCNLYSLSVSPTTNFGNSLVEDWDDLCGDWAHHFAQHMKFGKTYRVEFKEHRPRRKK